MRTFLIAAAVGTTCWLAGAATTQEAMEASMDDMMMAMPKPTAEHKALHDRVGVWDAEFKMDMGGQTMTGTDKMTYESFGDFWIVGRYEGDFMGEPFQGIEIAGYDPDTGEHVSYWLDTSSPAFSEMRGKRKDGAKTMKMKSPEPQMCHMTGQKEVMHQEVTVVDDDTFLFKMRPDSIPEATMEITYHRRK